MQAKVQSTPHTTSRGSSCGQHLAVVDGRRSLCEEHGVLRLAIGGFFAARAGQFIQILCRSAEGRSAHESGDAGPYLRRPFSIARLECNRTRSLIDIVYRVIGAGTAWLDGLERGEKVDIIGPLGNGFEIEARCGVAYLVAGGVGHPPIMMLARELEELRIRRVAFYGARSSSLIPFTFDGEIPGPANEVCVDRSAREWNESGTPLILATDDGSAGFGGNVVEVMDAYRSASGAKDEGIAVYACGPERMLEAVAKKAAEWGAPCQLAMETLMACGMGTCQSCVVAVKTGEESWDWRYRLCCTDGPVFRAESILWSGPG